MKCIANVASIARGCSRDAADKGQPMSEELAGAWQHIASQIIFQHPRITLIEDTIVLPTGQQTGWLRFGGSTDSVGLLCIDDQRRILVARQYNPAPQRIVHEFPGGGVEGDESIIDAARRELMEEVGLYPHRLEPLGSFLIDHRRSAGRQHVVLATEFEERRLTPELGEIIEFDWLGIDAVEEAIRSGAIENMFLLAIWTLFKLKHEHYFLKRET
jgi:8-oxo-dGTP pyrophosphatase MutT (NUDIX family)